MVFIIQWYISITLQELTELMRVYEGFLIYTCQNLVKN